MRSVRARKVVVGLAAVAVAVTTLALADHLERVPEAPEVPVAAATAGAPWRIVILRNWDAMYPVNVVREQALRAALLDKAPRPIEIYPEELDPLRFPEGHPRGFERVLREKYSGTRIDLIVASGLEPLEFALENRKDVWNDAPIVFNGVIEGMLDQWKRSRRTTGVTQVLDVSGTLATGLALAPGARHVHFVAGVGSFDQAFLDLALKAAKPYEGRVKVHVIDGLPLQEMLDRVRQVDPRSIVVYLTVLRDSTGQFNGPGSDFLTRVAKASPVPVLTAVQTQFRRGTVGGSSANTAAHGRAAGLLAREVLKGADPDAIPISATPSPTCELDWNALAQWKIPESRLPANCAVVNRPPSIWNAYFVPVLVMLSVILLQAALIGAFVVQRTMRRRAEEQLQARAAELAQASRMAMMGELTAGIAHEINQPIGAILGNAEAASLMLEQGTLDRDKLREILDDIREQDLRAGEVIQSLRNLMARREFKSVTLDLNLEVAEALRHVLPDAARREVRVSSVYGHGLPAIRGDSLQIQQIVINLVHNAIDAVGQLHESRRFVSVETRQAEGGAEIVICDRGTGIAPDHLDDVFNHGFTTKPQGMGFGLPIVRAIAEMHGGRVSYEPNASQGACFRVWLPVQPS